MRYFIDTEFIESGRHKPIQLISIGIVAEDGREFYAVSRDFNPEDASGWVKENVLAQIDTPLRDRMSVTVIASAVDGFVGDDKPEFWGYYADYDWVVFCQMFGIMMNLPSRFPMYCRDLKQLADDKGGLELPKQGDGEHNALADARWNKQAFDFLTSLPNP